MSTKPANEARAEAFRDIGRVIEEKWKLLGGHPMGCSCELCVEVRKWISDHARLAAPPHPAAPADAEDAEPALTCAQCDMPMSRNPHCAAGVPRTVHEIGAEWVCIPCTMRALNTCDTLKHQAYGELERIAKAIGYAGTYMKPGELRDAVIAALAAARRLLDAPPGVGEMWQCPKCKRWQSHERGICLSEYDTGIPCDGKQPHPAAPADAGDAMRRERDTAIASERQMREQVNAKYWEQIRDDNRNLNHQLRAKEAELAAARRLLDAPPGVGERNDAKDAARWRWIRPYLSTDGDVDDADQASRFYAWLKIKDEHIPLPDAVGYDSADQAVDTAIAALAAPAPAEPEKRS